MKDKESSGMGIRIDYDRYNNVQFHFVDLICFAYISVVGILIAIFHQNAHNWYQLIFIHIIMVLFIFEIVRLQQKHPRNRMIWLIRSFYPIVFYWLAWNELNSTVTMIFGRHWATQVLVDLDQFIFGVQPTVWITQFYTPLLDEIINIFYSGYYFFAPVIFFIFFFKYKREELLATVSIVSFTIFINFFLFYLLPALGPRMIESIENLRTVDYSGYLVADFTRYVQANGAVKGGCFPSSHISGAIVWALALFRYQKKTGMLLILLVFGVAFATVYLGYHHAVDPIAGLILGFMCYPIAIAILKKRGEAALLTNSN